LAVVGFEVHFPLPTLYRDAHRARYRAAARGPEADAHGGDEQAATKNPDIEALAYMHTPQVQSPVPEIHGQRCAGKPTLAKRPK
jgi:hypothetical protein